MKCPVITAGFWADPRASGADAIVCLKEECAWWDKVLQRCAIPRIAERLDQITYHLATMENKMPHEMQFRK
ncbi:unnamed protein product [marine sediment metagenome]|uniref:Uncharacterized protein n=1 Tax=marine sediment metagenome TaxID=412755 RepID=X1J5B4_9ZZZZ